MLFSFVEAQKKVREGKGCFIFFFFFLWESGDTQRVAGKAYRSFCGCI